MRKPLESHGDDARPLVSVVVPVLDESAGIAALIQHVRSVAGDYPHEIIVVDGDPEGGTIGAIDEPVVATEAVAPGGASIAAPGGGETAADNGRLTTLVAPVWRSRQMNAGAALARGGILLFLHADTTLPPGAFPVVARAARRAPAGAFSHAFSGGRLGWMSWGVNAFVRATGIGFGDQAVFVRADVLRSLGGYREIPVMEDVDLSLRLKGSGDRLIVVRERAETSPRRFEREGPWRRAALNCWMVLLFRLGASPARLARHYERR